MYEWPVRAVLADETERVFPVRVTISKDASTDLNQEGAILDALVEYAPEVSPKCSATAIGVGLPLLVLLPLGFASQMSLPLAARQNDLNLVVENALSVDLKLRDLNSRDVDLGIAAILAVAGLAGAGAIISQCVK